MDRKNRRAFGLSLVSMVVFMSHFWWVGTIASVVQWWVAGACAVVSIYYGIACGGTQKKPRDGSWMPHLLLGA